MQYPFAGGSLAGSNDHAVFVFVNCSGASGAPGFASKHNISKALHFHQENIPAEFGLQYIPHKAVIAADGTVVKNYDFTGTSLSAEVDKLK